MSHSATDSFLAPDLNTISTWLDLGQALRVQPWLDSLPDTADHGLERVRALRQLGAERAGDALALRLGRRFPAHADAQVAMLRNVLHRSTYAYWLRNERLPLPHDATAAGRANRLSLHSYFLAILRDERPALELQRKALTLAPNDAWLWVEHSHTLHRLDHQAEALRAAQHALALRPGHRTATLQAARLLLAMQRRDEARSLLEAAFSASEGASFAGMLHDLAADARQWDEALAWLDRAQAGLPLAEKSWHTWLAARRADALSGLGRWAQAREQALLVKVDGDTYYEELAERLAGLPEGATAPARRLLPLPLVQQHWMTCAPATLTALAQYWGRAADHLEVAQAICYDGTPQASERAWAEQQNFHTRECKLDWSTAVELIDAGIPFALATRHVGGGHLQAVVGYDALRNTLFIRDPNQPLHTEYIATKLFDSQQSHGPRAMILLPQEETNRLQGIELPEAALWDEEHLLLVALQRHDRAAAETALKRLQTLAPESDSTLRAMRNLASYDNDDVRLLAATQSLLARYPQDRNLQLSRLNSLYEVRGQAAGDTWLQELAAEPNPDAYLLIRRANRLALDMRNLPQARGMLRRAFRLDAENGRAWNEVAQQLWNEYGGSAGAQAAMLPSRWASTLLPTEEWAASIYVNACLAAGNTEQGLDWLRERNQTWGDRSGAPAITLANELDTLQRQPEADAVLRAASARRPNDNALRLHLAERALGAQDLDEAEAQLQACSEAHAPSLLRQRALLHEARGEIDAALAAAREALSQEPLTLHHHHLLLRLLRRAHGDAAALAEWRPLADAHPAHFGLQQLLYGQLPDEPGAINIQLAQMQQWHPANIWLQRERAIQASRQERHEEAVALAEAALALQPEYAASHDTLAYCRVRESGYAAAVPHIHAALTCDVEYESALRRLFSAPDPAGMQAAAAFIATQLRSQVLLGDGLLHFQDEACRVWNADALLALLQELRAKWPALWQGPIAEARQLAFMNQLDTALTVLQEAIERFPALPRVHLELARALKQAGRIHDATSANSRTLKLQPGWNAAVRLQVDLLCDHLRDWDRAEQVLLRALQDRHAWSDADLIALLGWVHERQGRDTDALAQARRALNLEPRHEWVWALARRICQRAETPHEFDALLDEVVASRPGDAAAWLVRAENARDDFAALASAEKAIALIPRNEAAWLARFERLQRLGRFQEIQQLLDQLPWPAQAPPMLRAWHARVLRAQDRHEDALEQLRGLYAEVPHNESLCCLLADWLDERKLHAEYVQQARLLLTLAPQSARSHLYLGHALLKNGQYSEAIHPLQRALELYPGYTFAAKQLVQAARKAGQPAVAEPALQALWPYTHDVATACEGIELGEAAGNQDVAFAWLERLFTLDEYELNRCQNALAALRGARWHARLTPLQNQHIMRGNGPAGVALDWLRQQQAHHPLGALGAYWKALRVQRHIERTTTGSPHLLRALLRWMLRQDVRTSVLRFHVFLDFILKRHDTALRADPGAWGDVSYTLAELSRYSKMVRWLSDWREHERPPIYALCNIANGLAGTGRWDELAELVQKTLTRQPDQENMRLWQLVLLARDDKLSGLQAALERCHEWRPDSWMEKPLLALRAYLALAEQRAGGGTVAQLRGARADNPPHIAKLIHRELLRLARRHHTPAARIWLWLLPPAP